MKLEIYKGFDISFLKNIESEKLIDNEIEQKVNVLCFDKKYLKKLASALLLMDDDETKWITYEEFSLIKDRIINHINDFSLEVDLYRNNLLPEYYPIPFEINNDLQAEVFDALENSLDVGLSEECSKYLDIYSDLININSKLYGSFYNYEYDLTKLINTIDYYPTSITIKEAGKASDYIVVFNNDVNTYLKHYDDILLMKPKSISYKAGSGEITKELENCLKAYCLKNSICLYKLEEDIHDSADAIEEYKRIAKDVVGIPSFKSFRDLVFYKNPDINNETVKISQGTIINSIIKQSEAANSENGNYRDIFITAPTGAGKSVMFQIPGVYLAHKYNKLTIIIEPVKALMQDQKDKLIKQGYTRVEAFNSDLITQVEREKVLDRIKNNEVDLLYLSPETLLSYSMETIIGDREIGLIIIDEAHIVTTWGVGFRPDYWYLGAYINRLRNNVNSSKKRTMKLYRFPICAFTATAVNGGIDDTVGDTIVSLYMENPIKYIGYVKREEISFNIKIKEKEKLAKDLYEVNKAKVLNDRLLEWLNKNQKTIVYYPYATYASDAYRGQNSFSSLKRSNRIGCYTGRKLEDISIEAFNQTKIR